MKKIIILGILLVFLTTCFAQDIQLKDYGQLPEVTLKKMDGTDFNTKDLQNGGKPYIVLFWAYWCYPCLRPLNAIQPVYDDWIKETGVKIFIISVTINQNLEKDQRVATDNGWKYEMLADTDSSWAKYYKQQPHILIFDGQQHIQWHTYGYSLDSGDEKKYIEVVRKIIAEKK